MFHKNLKIMLRILTISILIALSQLGVAQPEKIWETENLKTPESVYYHEPANVLFVSNINGKPTNKAKNGFITKMSLEGEIIKRKWAQELQPLKG